MKSRGGERERESDRPVLRSQYIRSFLDRSFRVGILEAHRRIHLRGARAFGKRRRRRKLSNSSGLDNEWIMKSFSQIKSHFAQRESTSLVFRSRAKIFVHYAFARANATYITLPASYHD